MDEATKYVENQNFLLNQSNEVGKKYATSAYYLSRYKDCIKDHLQTVKRIFYSDPPDSNQLLNAESAFFFDLEQIENSKDFVLF